MIFEATPEQIKQLDSIMLVQLMKRLMLAECRLADIPLRATASPLQITVADGGEDGRVEWTGGVDETDYFPARFCIFQSKAQNLAPASVKAEILKKQKSRAPKLNEAVLEVLSHRGRPGRSQDSCCERLSQCTCLIPVPLSTTPMTNVYRHINTKDDS